MSDRLKHISGQGGALSDIAVIRYPRISNFTDLDVYDAWPDMSVRYVTRPEDLGHPDLLILPGSKNTLADLEWLGETGLARSIRAYAVTGPVLGICGGFQMLGEMIRDPGQTERGGEEMGLGLLPVSTVLMPEKVQTRSKGRIGTLQGPLRELEGCAVQGYEIHMGRTVHLREQEAGARDVSCVSGSKTQDRLDATGSKAQDRSNAAGPKAQDRLDAAGSEDTCTGILVEAGNAYGTYLHGFFDGPEVIPALRRSLARLRGIELPEAEPVDHAAFKEREYDRLADLLRGSLDMKLIYGILGL